jgi:diguanylate cyclase (GGDEF)-like protein/PAS domain S-box-containing protein
MHRLSRRHDTQGMVEVDSTSSRLAAIVEGSHDAIIETDLDGRIRHVNRAVRSLFGYDPSELVGRHVSVLVPRDQLHEVTEAMSEVAAGRSVDTLTTQRLRRDGQLIDTSLRLSPVFDSSGHVVGISGITRDVSAEMETLARLQASEERFRARFYSSPMPQAMVNLQGRFETVNDAMCTLLGRTRNELEVTPLADLAHRSDGGGARAHLDAVLSGSREAGTWEVIATRPEGAALPLLVHAALLRHSDGQPYAVAMFIEDLTALRYAERALRRRESLFTALIEQASDWAVVLDPTGRLLLVTETFATTFGYDPAAVVGQDGWQFVHPDDQPRVRATLEATVDTGIRSDDVVFRLIDGKGTWRWVEHTFTNRLGEPDIAGIVSNGREVTDRVEAERALRASAARHRAIADAAQEGIWACDQAGRTIYANRKLAEIVGLTLPQVYQLTAPDVLDADGLLLVAQKLRDRQARGNEEYEVDYPHPDGATRRLRLSVCPLDDHSGPIGSLAMISDITQAARTAAELRQRALYDELTGLPNRTLLCDRLDQAVGRSRLPGAAPVTLMLADLDHFQLINDSWGHATGDLLLVEVAQRLTDAVGASNTVARFGGDTFVVICENADETQAQQIASGIQGALSAPFHLVGQRLHVTASIGIAPNLGIDSCGADELLRFADTAVHEAKTLGVGQVRVFDRTLAERAVNRLLLGNDLREALENDELDLHYQPIVELATGRVLGVEALARWHHPERGHVSPAEFVSIAETQGLAPQLDAWALQRACGDMAQLRAHLGQTATVSVNISAQHLGGADLEATVVAALQDSGLPAQALVLEITESAAMHDAEYARQLLTRLSARGVAVAIDDFGTGYSSLAYLNRLPAESLKIDRAFIDPISRDPDAFAVTAAIVDLARAMRLRTVGEGIETVDQLKLLRRLGCGAGQGFLWSPALPPHQLIEKLQELPHGRFNVHNRRRRSPTPPRTRYVDQPEVSIDNGLHRMLRLHNEGASLNTIAAALNTEGYRTPNGQRWHRATVARAITEIAYPDLYRRTDGRPSSAGVGGGAAGQAWCAVRDSNPEPAD